MKTLHGLHSFSPCISPRVRPPELDGSKQAESALLLASKLARINNVEYPFEMYSRCDSNALADPRQSDQKLQTEKGAICREAEDYLKRVASIVEMTVSKVFIEVQECPVVDAILSSTKKLKIDLIVMSTVGGDLSPWMMGAVTNRVLREAQIPVILMRTGSGGLVPDDSHRQRTSVQNEIWIHPSTLSY